MNILVLDVYPTTSHRISKDQNGGYGTANNYGNSIFGKFLNLLVSRSIDFPPLFCVQVIGELRKKNHNVTYLRKIPKNLNEFELVLITSSIVSCETDIRAIKDIKEKFEIQIIAIGPFASSNPEHYVKAGAKVIKGEPEMYFHDFSKNISDLENEEPIIECRKQIALDELALPGWDIIFDYKVPTMKFLGSGPAVNINASRGCPYSCFYYCTYPLQQGRKLRLKSSERLIQEINHLNKTLKVKNFIFRDPVFSLDKNHAIEVCKAIIKNKLKINICIETHLKNIDDELATFFKQAGIKLIYVGIESSDADVRKNAKRQSEENDKQIEKINYLEKLGIKVKAMYILGLPSDTSQTFKNTVSYAKKLNSSYAQFSVFTPYPGTPAYQDYKDKINVANFEDFTQWKLAFEHDNFTKEEVDELLINAYKNYYLRFNWILKRFINLFKF